MDHSDAEIQVIREAERTVHREKWRICEERAAGDLAHTTSLRWTRLFPQSPVIQVVAPAPARRDRGGPQGAT